jgi:myosin heavy subunit
MNNKTNLTAWTIVAVIGLLGLNAYQWFSNNQLKTQNAEQVTLTQNLQKAQAELDQDYQAALDNLEQMRSDNTAANELIDSQKKELEVQKSKISDLIWSKRELGKAQDEMKTLNNRIKDMIAEVTKLKEENVLLTEQNSELSTQNQSLTVDLTREREEKDEVVKARTQLASEKESLSKSNEALSSKVDMASAIKINFLDVKGFEIKKNGKLDQQSRAKNIDLLRFCIKTETNMVTPAGMKRFFIRVISPLGETVAIEDNGSGVLTNRLDNTQIRYSTSGEVEYKNEDTNACIDWTLSQKLTKGLYNVEIYNGGFPVGKGTFQMK